MVKEYKDGYVQWGRIGRRYYISWLKNIKGYMFKWLRMGRGICSMVEDRKEVLYSMVKEYKNGYVQW